jgi:hypothetical protein
VNGRGEELLEANGTGERNMTERKNYTLGIMNLQRKFLPFVRYFKTMTDKTVQCITVDKYYIPIHRLLHLTLTFNSSVSPDTEEHEGARVRCRPAPETFERVCIATGCSRSK